MGYDPNIVLLVSLSFLSLVSLRILDKYMDLLELKIKNAANA